MKLHLRHGLAMLALGLSLAAHAAPARVEDLATPPADARHFDVVSRTATHGHLEAWTRPDGTHMERLSVLLRGFVTETETATRLGPDGMPASVSLRGFTASGDAAETFSVADGTATWKSQVDAGSAPYRGAAWYVIEGPDYTGALFAEALLAAPGHTLALLPGGRARAERIAESTVDGPGGARLECWAIDGVGVSPYPVWMTADGRFFGFVGGLAVLPAGRKDLFEPLRLAQERALAARSAATAHTLLQRPATPVAFTHVRAFVDGTRFAEDQTVVVEGGSIRAVGPAAVIAVPANARRIDGQGRTLVPGLWDSHQHLGDDSSGPFLLSLGITSARDPGNNDVRTVDQARRRAAGDLLWPHVYPSSMIDGRGPFSAQLGTVVGSLDEALAAVQRTKDDAFTGIKLYGSFDPAWVAPVAARAHALGLHVHGHVPAGMRPSQAIRAGYDEITHVYFLAMEAMPDEVIAHSNGLDRFQGPVRYARGIDLAAEPMKSLIALMAERHVAADPTLVLGEGLMTAENGVLAAAYRPYTGTLPPTTERSFREGGLQLPPDLTRRDAQASVDKLSALVGALHRAGVRIVAGTDGSGMELVRELELYVQAGFTNAEALASATIEAARNVGVDARTGRIAPGQAADLALVEGDPSTRIGDLRHTRIVMLDGVPLDADVLRKTAGFSGRPHDGP